MNRDGWRRNSVVTIFDSDDDDVIAAVDHFLEIQDYKEGIWLLNDHWTCVSM